MSVSGELLCSFELLKPLDSSALKSHIKKGRNKRQSMLNSPVSTWSPDIPEAPQLTTTPSRRLCLLKAFSGTAVILLWKGLFTGPCLLGWYFLC